MTVSATTAEDLTELDALDQTNGTGRAREAERAVVHAPVT